MPTSWLLLVYTVPAEPSRLRATVWRELKKVGAVYLRDGVCALPEGEPTLAAFRALAERVTEFGGQATLVRSAQLDPERAGEIVERSRAARAEEYTEVLREATRLSEHVKQETEHREFTFAELGELEADLGKLLRWFDQVRARDYFEAGPPASLHQVLARCQEELAFLERAYRATETAL